MVEPHAGVQPNVVGSHRIAFLLVSLAQSLKRLQVIGPDALGIEYQRLAALGVLQIDHPPKRKRRLGLVKHVEHDHVVAGMTQLLQPANHLVGISQQVAEDHQQAAVTYHRGDPGQVRTDLGQTPGLRTSQQSQHVGQLGPLAPSRQAGTDRLVKSDQTHRVLLVDHQVPQRRGQANAVVELGQLLAMRVGHALGEIHHQVPGDVGFRLVLLDVEAIGLGVDQPVDQLRIVALDVAAVFAEFDREPVKRAGVQTAQKTLDNEPRPQIQPSHTADDLRLQVLFDRWHECKDQVPLRNR